MESGVPVNVLEAMTVVPPGFLLGVPLFGTFGALVLIMFFVSALATPRSRGGAPRLGALIALLVLILVVLVVWRR